MGREHDCQASTRTTYGVLIVWTPYPGGRRYSSVEGQPTQEAAWRLAHTWAVERGWTPPRWWEVWRWHDTRFPPDLP